MKILSVFEVEEGKCECTDSNLEECVTQAFSDRYAHIKTRNGRYFLVRVSEVSHDTKDLKLRKLDPTVESDANTIAQCLLGAHDLIS